jgi:hypothetical protein
MYSRRSRPRAAERRSCALSVLGCRKSFVDTGGAGNTVYRDHGRPGNGPVHVREAFAAGSGLPTNRPAKRLGIESEDNEGWLVFEIALSGRGDLGPGRAMDEPALEIEGRAVKPTSRVEGFPLLR